MNFKKAIKKNLSKLVICGVLTATVLGGVSASFPCNSYAATDSNNDTEVEIPAKYKNAVCANTIGEGRAKTEKILKGDAIRKINDAKNLGEVVSENSDKTVIKIDGKIYEYTLKNEEMLNFNDSGFTFKTYEDAQKYIKEMNIYIPPKTYEYITMRDGDGNAHFAQYHIKHGYIPVCILEIQEIDDAGKPVETHSGYVCAGKNDEMICFEKDRFGYIKAEVSSDGNKGTIYISDKMYEYAEAAGKDFELKSICNIPLKNIISFGKGGYVSYFKVGNSKYPWYDHKLSIVAAAPTGLYNEGKITFSNDNVNESLTVYRAAEHDDDDNFNGNPHITKITWYPDTVL